MHQARPADEALEAAAWPGSRRRPAAAGRGRRFAGLAALLAGGLVALAAAAPRPAAAQSLPPGIPATETLQLADGLYAFRWGAYRSLFVVTAEGVIATDPLSPEAAERYRAEIARVTDQPVRYVVYSHAHWDHARGGAIFKAEGAQFVAQSRCLDSLRDSPHPDIVPPDIVFDARYSVELGGRSLDLFYFGPSHGTCLIVMIPRPHPMIYTVDIVTPRPTGGGYLPWDPQVADFQFYGAVESLRAVEALVEREGVTTVIGAHLVPIYADGGFRAAPATGPVSAIRERREFWEGLMAAVRDEMAAGTDSFLVSARLDPAPWADLPNYEPRRFRQLVDRIAAYYAIGK